MLDAKIFQLIASGVLETFYMTLVSTLLAYLAGLPLGVLLVVTDTDGIRPLPLLSKVLGFVINIMRSVPFVILMVVVMPLTRAITGTTLGPTATIVPLFIAAAPFVGRMVESSLKEVDRGVVEAAQSMGAGTMRIITKVLLPEARPSLVTGAAIAVTTILGYSAMSGFTGGGGLGTIAINYGYIRRQEDIMFIAVVLLVLIVQGFQEAGTRITKKIDKRLH